MGRREGENVGRADGRREEAVTGKGYATRKGTVKTSTVKLVK